MRIVLDTGDLNHLAAVAHRSARTVHSASNDIRQARNSVDLNTRDDHRLRRQNPDGDLHRIHRNLQRAEQRFEQKARHYEHKARQARLAGGGHWRPLPIPIDIGPPRAWWGWPVVVPPIPLPNIGSLLPRLPWPGFPSIAGGIVKRAPSMLEKGIGFLKRGIGNLLKGFQDVAGKLIETVRGAWDRVWSGTKTLLSAAVTGLKNIAVFSGKVVVNKITTVIKAGKWLIGGVAKGLGWVFSTGWNAIANVAAVVSTVLDIAKAIPGALSLDKFATLFSKIPTIFKFVWKYSKYITIAGVAIAGISALVAWNQYGLGDARFWRSLLDLGATIAIPLLVAAATAGAAPALVVAFGAVLAGLVWHGSGWATDKYIAPWLLGDGDSLSPPTERDLDRLLNDYKGGETERLRELVLSDPRKWGNDDRIPPSLRIEANRLSMEKRLQELADQRWGNLDTVEEVVRLSRWLEEDPPRRFIVFDPEKGLIAEVLGSPIADASTVSVVVPGIGNSIENFDDGPRSDARSLLDSLGGPTGGASVIAWLGYDAPPGIELATLYEGDRITNARDAEIGGRSLQGFVSGLNNFRGESSRLSILGHSYGSRVVGEAAMLGMSDVDDILFIGSPGVGADSLQDFRVDGGTEFHAFQDSDDPVTHTPKHILGKNPAEIEGINVHTTPGVGDDGGIPQIGSHSEYYENLSDRFARIIGGMEEPGALDLKAPDTSNLA